MGRSLLSCVCVGRRGRRSGSGCWVCLCNGSVGGCVYGDFDFVLGQQTLFMLVLKMRWSFMSK